MPSAAPCAASIAQIESARNADSACAETPEPAWPTQRLTVPSTSPTRPNARGSASAASAPALPAAASSIACIRRAIAVRVPETAGEPVALRREEPVPRN